MPIEPVLSRWQWPASDADYETPGSGIPCGIDMKHQAGTWGRMASVTAPNRVFINTLYVNSLVQYERCSVQCGVWNECPWLAATCSARFSFIFSFLIIGLLQPLPLLVVFHMCTRTLRLFCFSWFLILCLPTSRGRLCPCGAPRTVDWPTLRSACMIGGDAGSGGGEVSDHKIARAGRKASRS